MTTLERGTSDSRSGVGGALLVVRSWKWFVGSAGEPLTPWRTILWWEARRLPFNALLGLLGCVALPLFLVAISRSGALKPGDDAVEPLALLVAPVLVNVAYTFGWGTELVVNVVRQSGARRVGPSLLRLGLAVSAVVVLSPAALALIASILSCDKRMDVQPSTRLPPQPTDWPAPSTETPAPSPDTWTRYKVDDGRFSVVFPKDPRSGSAGAIRWSEASDTMGNYYLVTCGRSVPGENDEAYDFALGTLKAHGPPIKASGTNGGEVHVPFPKGKTVSELVWSFANGAEQRERAVGLGMRSCSWIAVSVTPQGKGTAVTFAESFRPE